MARTQNGSRTSPLDDSVLVRPGPPPPGVPRFRPWLVALLLGAIGYGLNLLAIPVMPGIDLLLGSIPGLVVATAYGPGPGMLAQAVAGSRTIALWGHPWGMLMLVGEAAVVGALRERLRPVFAVGLYWVLFGLWFGLFAYAGVLGVSMPMAVLALLKQMLNGLGNALAAEGLLLLGPVRRALNVPGRPSVRHYLGVLAALAGGIPLVVLWLLTTRQEVETVLDEAAAKVRLSTLTLGEMVADDPRPELPAVRPGSIVVIRAEGLRLRARRPDGVILRGTAEGRMEPVWPDSLRATTMAAAAAARVAGTGVPRVGGYADAPRGLIRLATTSRRSLLAAEWVDRTGWLVWTELPYPQILRVLSDRVIGGEMIMLVALAGALAAAAWVSRAIERPLSALVAGTRRVAAREPGVRLEPDVTGSMVPAELVLLTERFDAMAARLDHLERQRNRLLEKAEQRREEVERLMESRARLIRGFTHDVKNPLGAANGYLALLDEDVYGELNEEQRESVGRVRRSIGAALALIGDLVELARAEAGQLHIRTQPVDVGEAVEAVAQEYRAQVESSGLELTVAVPPDLPVVSSDPRRIHQILGNLLSNAVKFSRAGDRIAVRADVADGVGTPGPGRWVVVSVADTGPGIPEEQQSRIFQEYVRLQPGRTPGTGLGLAISRRVAQALHGDLTFESVEGKGTTFRLWLPLDEAGG